MLDPRPALRIFAKSRLTNAIEHLLLGELASRRRPCVLYRRSICAERLQA